MSTVSIASIFSPLSLLNGLAALAPVERSTNIAYGEGPRHKLDVYRPRDGSGHTVAMFIYGGGWEEGDRDMYRFVGAALASAGFVTVVPDYRIFPEVRFPAFIEDGARATRWAYDNAAAYGGNSERLVMIGHSAGAHIAAMLALDPQWLEATGLPRHALKALVGLAGPYDFVPDTDNRRQIFGPEAQRARTQPISFARPDAPPALFATGSHDRIVDPGNSTRLASKLNGVGADATTRLYPHASHESLIGAFSPALRFIAPVWRDTVDFVARHTAGTNSERSKAA